MEMNRSSRPKIACISVIGKADNPLLTSLFPPYLGSSIEFSLLLNSCLDVFEIRQKQTSVDQDLGLLHAVDERLAVYGWLTTTGVKLLVVVDLIGQAVSPNDEGRQILAGNGVKESDMKPVFRALQMAYIQLLQNPFYSPDAYGQLAKTSSAASDSLPITNSKFIAEVKRIGESWVPGAVSL
ncbi:Sedlin [Aspergillus steynii IBT 23096]|uniref:Sedlin n=1 Tax=Aspergillus steynii IBT 23096 TaxID=1392250 RepID=A0A2I2FTW6_9EURO|nr:Sedlin [Aspergillus steynii IBT 23096]PLB44083.1 Sedlin [Aspergillus steynii IBT 23096]